MNTSKMQYAFEHDGTATGIAMRAAEHGREKSLVAMVLGDRADARLMETRERKKKADATLIRVLSIDAWRDADGWQWNQWYEVGKCPLSVCDLSPRKLLAYLRAEGFLSAASVGRVALEDDQLNIVILDRGTRQPLFALEHAYPVLTPRGS